MYPILHDLLSDRKGGTVFTCFDLWHWCWLVLTAGAVALAAMKIKKLDTGGREEVLGR